MASGCSGGKFAAWQAGSTPALIFWSAPVKACPVTCRKTGLVFLSPAFALFIRGNLGDRILPRKIKRDVYLLSKYFFAEREKKNEWAVLLVGNIQIFTGLTGLGIRD